MTSEIGKFVETLVKDEQKDLVSSVEDNHVGVINKREDIGVQPLSNVKNITKDLLLIESEKDGITAQESVMKFPTLTNTTEPLNINSIDNNNRKNIECSDSNIIVNEYNMIDIDRGIENSDTQTGSVNSSIQEYNADIDNQLPETVTLLRTPNGGKLYLVGTAHFSIESQNDVSKIIQAVQPHIVVVELCRARIGILQLDEQVMYHYAKHLNLQSIQGTFKEYGLYNGLLNILLLKMVAHITKELGMAPGGEFRRAFEEAKKVPYCMFYMGDRPIDITIQRTVRFLSWWQTIKLVWHLIKIKDPISKKDVELCKQKAYLDEMVAKMSGEFPVLGEVFIKERDIYLTHSLQLACLPEYTSKGLEPTRVVGVVGLGHIPGIVDNWGKVQPSDIPPIMSIPPLSLSSKILKFTFKASLIGAVIYVGYKIIPLDSIKSSVQGLLKNLSSFFGFYIDINIW
ncbi:traB domain-containing protein-like isoform X3 [Vespa mandarinia]|uniref:traB domain-containing protein-like isoform X3 n=2 Tax=Vespa mandarinia TaxID=7446 RepID=UPI001609C5E8|nr:traB domain-containing protein-like isoform X3 [Vespa mandarinia]